MREHQLMGADAPLATTGKRLAIVLDGGLRERGLARRRGGEFYVGAAVRR